MNGTNALRMQFMHDTRTDVWIAEQTGIPRSTLGFVRRGERELPTKYADALRSFYQGEAQGYLESRGYPEKVASEYSSAMPSRLIELTSDLDHYIERIAELHTAKAQSIAEEAGKGFNTAKHLKDSIEAIRNNIAQSDLDYDELVDRFADYVSQAAR